MLKIKRIQNLRNDILYQVRIETDNYYLKLSITDDAKKGDRYHAYIRHKHLVYNGVGYIHQIQAYETDPKSLRVALSKAHISMNQKLFERI